MFKRIIFWVLYWWKAFHLSFLEGKRLGYSLFINKNYPPVHVMKHMCKNKVLRDIFEKQPGGYFVYMTKRKKKLEDYLDAVFPSWRKTSMLICLCVVPDNISYYRATIMVDKNESKKENN